MWMSSPKSNLIRKSALFSPSARLEMLWGTWETASTMPRHSTPPMLAFPSRAPSMLPRKRRISFYSKKIWVFLCKVCAKGDDVCEYTEVCVHGHKRQFREHVQHGRSIPLAPISSIAAQADFADQFTNRFSGDDNRHRQRGQRNGRLSSALGHQSDSQVYDGLRPRQFGI